MEQEQRAKFIDEKLHALGLGRPAHYELPGERKMAWRVPPEPFDITVVQKQTMTTIGTAMQRFYRAADKLYHLGLMERDLHFVVEYVDAGKPAKVVELSRHSRFNGQLPLILRPDLLWTESGFVASEFDSIPGGVGLLSGMEEAYGSLGHHMVDTAKAFVKSISLLHKQDLVAIVVSQESSGYRAEMEYLAGRASNMGLPIVCLKPEEVDISKDGVFSSGRRIGTIYRFFELFDLANVPGGYELLRAAANGLVQVTPPPKAYLEEKLWFSLLRHHRLVTYWARTMGKKWYDQLLNIIPQTYILDNRALPPHGVIAGITKKGQDVSSFLELSDLPRGDRQYVIKPSGFSPESWGSKGVILGRDIGTRSWGEVLERSLQQFPHNPHILQKFHYSLLQNATHYDFESESLETLPAKLRYCPYYFTGTRNTVLEGGVLITACPAEKPLIHGMTDAVMGPGD